MTRRPNPSLAANPVLVGAATVLVVLVGVFLAYNANSGLPFVPTYQVDAIVPDAAELVPGNDVRVGGKRVGVISAITAQERAADGHVTAKLHLKLEKPLEPLAADSTVTVRPRSPLGLKYLELQPGRGRRTIPDGGVLPESQAQPLVDLDEALNTFDHEVRRGTQEVVTTFADGLAARGADLNAALEGLDPLVTHLQPVMRALRSRSADLPGFLAGLRGAAEAVAPVRTQLSALLGHGATTFDALDRARDGVAATLTLAPAVEREGTQTLAVARPVLEDAAAISRAIRPGTALLRRGTDRLADVVETGTPVLRRATTLGPDLERTLRATRTLSKDPITSGAIRQLTAVVTGLRPTLEDVNPFQTQCNAIGLFARNASEVISEGDAAGNWFRFIPIIQPSEMLRSTKPAATLHTTPYGIASREECETGNEPYVGTQVIGHPAGVQPNRTEQTHIPEGVPTTP